MQCVVSWALIYSGIVYNLMFERTNASFDSLILPDNICYKASGLTVSVASIYY